MTTGVVMLMSFSLFGNFAWWDAGADIFGDGYGQKIHHVTQVPWIEVGNATIEYFVGVDGLSFPLVILTTLADMATGYPSFGMPPGPAAEAPELIAN